MDNFEALTRERTNQIFFCSSVCLCLMMIIKFFSHQPESLHMFTLLFDDLGVPQVYRHMEGSGVNTCTLINKAGEAHCVKFHWNPTCVGQMPLLSIYMSLLQLSADKYPEWKRFIRQ
ncbi:hypothetical protein GQ457_03G035960 [Hibiscus cannabinus]